MGIKVSNRRTWGLLRCMDDFLSHKNKKVHSKRGSGGVLLKVIKSMFSWVGQFVTREAKEASVEKEREQQKKRFLSRYPIAELLASGENSIKKLEEARDEFLQKAGSAGTAFVARNIDPVLTPLRQFIFSLKNAKPDEQSLIRESKEVLGTIELIALARDEKRLWKRIRENLERQTSQALVEDIAFIMAYPGELLKNAHVPETQQTRILKSVESEFRSIFFNLEKLLEKHPISDDLYSLFCWRTTIDNERQSLHDAAIKLIEEKLSPYRLKFSKHGENVLWLGQTVEMLSFAELNNAIQYVFELIKFSEEARSDELVLEFFSQCKERIQLIFDDSISENDRFRFLHTVQLIEEILGPSDKFT